jgi:hypothetical protein
MKFVLEVLFYSLYKSQFRYVKKDTEALTVFFISFCLSLNFYFIPLLIFEQNSISIDYSKAMFISIIILLFILNYIFFEKDNHYRVVVQKFRQYNNQKIFNLIGVIFPMISFSLLFLYIDLSISTISIVFGIYILFEILGIYFGNEWKK